MSRAQAIRTAIVEELARRAALLDVTDDLAQVTITIRLAAESGRVRGIDWREERVYGLRRDERRTP